MSRRSVWVLAWAVAFPLLAHAADDPGKPGATLRIDPANPEVGSVFQLVLEVHAPRGSVVALPGKAAPLQPFEVVDYDSSESNEGAGLVTRGRYKLLGSLGGKAELGPLTVRLKLPDGKDQDLIADSVSFELKSVLATLDPTPSDILPIKGPVPFPETARPWSRWGIAGAIAGGFTLIGLTLWLLLRRRKPVAPPEAAHVVAMRQLQELTRRELDSSDAVERFYVELSGVVRRYLERRFHAPVMEQTTQEIKRLFDPGVHGANWTFRLHQLLERMDLVKFARFRISTSAAFEDLQMAESLIQEVVERDAQAEAERLRRQKLEPVEASNAGVEPGSEGLMRLANPIFLLLGLYLPILAARYFHPRWKSPAPTMRFPTLLRARRAQRLAGRSWAWLVPVLRLAALAAFIIAAAGPQLVGVQQRIHGEGVDIVVALDISGSMEAADFRPKNRLEVAKDVLAHFIEGRPGDRLGLVVFAGKSFTQCPLTLDHAFLKELLEQVDPKLSPQQGTAIGTGLANAVNRLRESQAKSRLVVLLTDGRNNAGQIDPITAANMAKTLGLRVYTIGVGKDKYPPMPTEWFGQIRYVQSTDPMDPDEDLLKRIASSTGARYYRATDATTMQAIFQEIDALEKSKFETEIYAQYDELMKWPLMAGCILLLLQLILANARYGQLP